jgi:hypothetical protein
MKVIRLLANSYKHDPAMEADEDLLKSLNLEIQEERFGKKKKVNYAPLPESDSLQEGLATFIGFGKDADYCDIAERFIDIAGKFLIDVQSRVKLSPF